MIKLYCDCCGSEITNKNKINLNKDSKTRLTGELRKPGGPSRLTVEVITAKDSTWNDGDFCKYCVIDAINRADDRPKIGLMIGQSKFE